MASQLVDAAAYHLGNLILNRNPANRRTIHKRSISESSKPATLEEAINFRNKNMIKQWTDDIIKDYPIISTPLDTLGEYGVGIELHFVFLKQLGILFFIISIISVMPIYLNSQGGYYEDRGERYFFDRWSIGNQEGLDSDENSLKEAEDFTDTIDRNHLMILLPDIVYTFIFIIFLIWYRFNSYKIVRRNLKYNVTVADYSVEVKGFPRKNIDPGEVKDHFSKFGEVVEVSLARRYDGLLRKYKTRADYTHRLEVERILAPNKKKSKKIKNYEKLIRKFDEDVYENENKSDKTHDELPVDRAYVIFNEVRHMKVCLKAYSNSSRCCMPRKYQPDYLKYQGRYPLKVIPTVEPDNILWENLEVGKFNRFMRKVFVVATTLITMVGSIAVIYYLKSIDNEIPSDEKCKTYNINYDLDLVKVEDELNEKEILCYCQKKSYHDNYLDSDWWDVCGDYSSDYGIRIAAAFGVVVVNFILRIILKILSQFERSSSINKEHRKTMMKFFVAVFINTALITLVVNADFRDLEFTKKLAFKEYLFNGDYKDFDRDWYLNVGSTFVIMMFISTLSPHILYLILAYPLNSCKRECGWKKCKTQHEINSIFIGPEFDRAGKTAQILSVVFICFLYSGGMPILNVLCFFTLFFMYWIDKILILRYFRKPPMVNHSLNDRVIAILPYAIIMHCAVSLYMYGSHTIFPTGFYKVDNGTDINILPESESIKDRIKRSSGIAMIGLMGLALLTNLLNISITKIISRLRKSKLIKENKNKGDKQGSYIEEINNIKDHGLETYNIAKNLTYKPLIEALNSAARHVKRLKKEQELNTGRSNSHSDLKSELAQSLSHNSNYKYIDGELKIELEALNGV